LARYHSKEAQVYMSTTAAGAAVAVAGVTSWTFDGSTDKVDVTAFGDANKFQVQGLGNAGGTINFVWDDTDTTLFDAAESGEAVKMYLYRDAANAATHYRYGTAYVDISEDTNITSAVTGSATFVGADAWARKP
jgi:hypothetical protein